MSDIFAESSSVVVFVDAREMFLRVIALRDTGVFVAEIRVAGGYIVGNVPDVIIARVCLLPVVFLVVRDFATVRLDVVAGAGVFVAVGRALLLFAVRAVPVRVLSVFFEAVERVFELFVEITTPESRFVLVAAQSRVVCNTDKPRHTAKNGIILFIP